MDIKKIAREFVDLPGNDNFSPSLLVDFYNFLQKKTNMKRETKRIILVGHAASGKDYLAAKFVEKGFRKDLHRQAFLSISAGRKGRPVDPFKKQRTKA